MLIFDTKTKMKKDVKIILNKLKIKKKLEVFFSPKKSDIVQLQSKKAEKYV